MASVKVVHGSSGAEVQITLDKGDVVTSSPTGVVITNAPTLAVESVATPPSAPAAVHAAQAAPQTLVAGPAPVAQPVAAGPSAVVVS